MVIRIKETKKMPHALPCIGLILACVTTLSVVAAKAKKTANDTKDKRGRLVGC